MKNKALTNQPNQAPVANPRRSIEDWMSSPNVRKKFEDVLDKNASAFMVSILSLVKNNSKLGEAAPETIMAAAMTAASLKLPINPSLGLAYIIPYKNYDPKTKKSVSEAQFQMGWKGFVQLAERSGQYRTINAAVVYEGQIKDIDFITGEIVRGEKVSNTVIGYIAYMELINGFKKTLYMTADEMMAHARQYSKAYAYDLRDSKKSSVWTTNFDAMALKTVLKLLISKYGVMSIEMNAMQTAIEADQAVVAKGGYKYVDNDGREYEVEPEPAETESEVQNITPSEETTPTDNTRNSPQEATGELFEGEDISIYEGRI